MDLDGLDWIGLGNHAFLLAKCNSQASLGCFLYRQYEID